MIKKIFLLFFFLAFFAFPKQAFAQSADKKEMIGVSPVIFDLKLNQGESKTYELKIDNLLSVPLGIKLNLETLDATDEDTGMRFEKPLENTPLLSWIKISKIDSIIAENQQETIEFTINVPKNVKNGGYYGILFITPIVTKPIDRLSPTVLSRVGVLLLVNIGEQKGLSPDKKIKIIDFHFNNVFENSKANLFLRVQNVSADIITAKPIITISKILETKKTIEIGDKRILPEKIRRWQQNINLEIGIYKAQAAVSVGSGEYVYKNTTFLVFPIKQIAFYILIVITIVFVILARKRIKKAVFVFFKKR